MRKIVIAGLACLIFSCAQIKGPDTSFETSEASSNARPTAMKSRRQPESLTDGKKLIKRADYRFRVESVEQTTKHLEQCMPRYNSYISSSTLTQEYNTLENNTVIRVPSTTFDSLLQHIDGIALKVIFRNVSTEDVTKDFVDLESRLRAKRELESRYIEILRTKTGSVEDLLAAEKQIGELHEEIEATISRFNLLKDQVHYSTIKLQYFEILPEELAVNDTNIFADINDAFRSGLNGSIAFLVGLIYIWPIILIAGGVVVYWRLRRKRITVRS